MMPQPPFSWDLSAEEEIASFEALKPKLVGVWDSLAMRGEDQPHTSVVVPSLTLDRKGLEKLAGASFYEERLLFLLIRLRNPLARMVYVTSEPVHPMILEYYFQLLAGIPASHARARLTLLCAYDSSPRSLTEKVLERPRLIQRIREGIKDPDRAYLTVFNSTPLERKLAVLLGIPMNGADPQLAHLGTKSGSRKVFRKAGVALPEGKEDLRDRGDVLDALVELGRNRPGLKRAVIKLNDSFSGEGNAVLRFPESRDARGISGAMEEIELSVADETPIEYFAEFAGMGGIVEEFIEGVDKVSPSAQLRISPGGQVLPISTHDQILGGPSQQVFLGCSFPARDDYRQTIQEAALAVGEVLGSHGVVSRFGVDFLLWKDEAAGPWRMCALEINLRMGGTTHPYLALQFLTGGSLDADTGHFWSPSGQAKCYRATDNLQSPAYRGLLPEDLIDILTVNRLHYNHGTESGALFHLIGAVSEFGKLGLTAIANSHEHADDLYHRTLTVLDRETSYGR